MTLVTGLLSLREHQLGWTYIHQGGRRLGDQATFSPSMARYRYSEWVPRLELSPLQLKHLLGNMFFVPSSL